MSTVSICLHQRSYWEDMVSMVVNALHTLYLGTLPDRVGERTGLLVAVAIAAYVTYVINAAQFLLKLRLARLSEAN